MPYAPAFATNTRPTWAPRTTSKKAKKEYKKHGPRLSSQEARQLDRQIELEKRASKIKDAEDRKRTNAKKRAEKDEKQRQAQKPGVPVSSFRFPSSQGSIDHFVKRATRSEAVNDGQASVLETEQCPTASRPECRLVTPAETSEETPSQFQDVVLKRKQSPVSLRSSQKRRKLMVWEDPPEYDDFDISSTQISRELLKEVPKVRLPELPVEPYKVSKGQDNYASLPQDSFLDLLSTQDVALSVEDVEELAPSCTVKQPVDHPSAVTENTVLQKKAQERMLMPPPRIPFKPVRPTQSLNTLPQRNIPKLRSRSILAPTEVNKKQSVESIQSRYALDNYTLSDFDLSSQDNRDIFG